MRSRMLNLSLFSLSPASPLSCFSSLLNPSSCLSCQLYPLNVLHYVFPVLSLFSVFRHAACSPGGIGCSSEESSDPRSAPALSRQLLFIQPETQTGSATAPGCTLHWQVRNRCRHTLIWYPYLSVSFAIASYHTYIYCRGGLSWWEHVNAANTMRKCSRLSKNNITFQFASLHHCSFFCILPPIPTIISKIWFPFCVCVWIMCISTYTVKLRIQ